MRIRVFFRKLNILVDLSFEMQERYTCRLPSTIATCLSLAEPVPRQSANARSDWNHALNQSKESQFEDIVETGAVSYILGEFRRRCMDIVSSLNTESKKRPHQIGWFCDAYHAPHADALGYTMNPRSDYVDKSRPWVGYVGPIRLWEIVLQIVAMHGNVKTYREIASNIGDINPRAMHYLHTAALFKAAMRGHRVLFRFIWDKSSAGTRDYVFAFAADAEFLRYIQNYIGVHGLLTSDADIIGTMASILCQRRCLDVALAMIDAKCWGNLAATAKYTASLRYHAPLHGFVEAMRETEYHDPERTIYSCFMYDKGVEAFEYLHPEKRILPLDNEIDECIVQQQAWGMLCEMLERGYVFPRNELEGLLRHAAGSRDDLRECHHQQNYDNLLRAIAKLEALLSVPL